MGRRGRARGAFGFAASVVESALGAGSGIGAADGRGSNRSLHRMWTVHVGLPHGRDFCELGGEGGRGGILVPRVQRVHAGMPDWRSSDEWAGRRGPPWRGE